MQAVWYEPTMHHLRFPSSQVFNDSQISKNFGTYEFGILDFHREYHWVAPNHPSVSDEPAVALAHSITGEDTIHCFKGH